MIVLDTDVVSETMRHVPNPKVVDWLNAQPRDDLYLSAPVLAELCYGTARLKPSKRKSALLWAYQQLVAEKFAGRILAFDVQSAELFGELIAKLERDGRTMGIMDAMIAAIALSNGATLATRNMSDFAHTGLALLDPFGANQ